MEVYERAVAEHGPHPTPAQVSQTVLPVLPERQPRAPEATRLSQRQKEFGRAIHLVGLPIDTVVALVTNDPERLAVDEATRGEWLADLRRNRDRLTRLLREMGEMGR